MLYQCIQSLESGSKRNLSRNQPYLSDRRISVVSDLSLKEAQELPYLSPADRESGRSREESGP